MLMVFLLFLSGFLLSVTAAYYSIVGLIAIFPGATVAIVAMGVTLELAKLVAASWLYRNWSQAPFMLKSYLISAVALLMFITSMGIFGFLSKAHLEHSITSSADSSYELQTLEQTIESRQKTATMLERQINNIDASLEKYLTGDVTDVTRGLAQKRRLDAERKELEAERKVVETELIELKTKRNTVATEVKKQEVEVGPLKYIAELIYGESAESHFDSAVRSVIILLVLVFDPLAVVLLIAGNVSLQLKKALEPRPKRKYTRRKPIEPHDMDESNEFGVETADEDEVDGGSPFPWVPSVLRRK